MGYTTHKTIIATVGQNGNWPGYPTIENLHANVCAVRAAMPSEMQHLLIGPVDAAVNYHFTYVLLPSGSKEGWDTDQEWQRTADAFVALFEGYGCTDVVSVHFGEDYRADFDEPSAHYENEEGE